MRSLKEQRIRMNNKKIFHNYIYNLSYQIFSILAPLITTPYVSRVLEADGVGMYSYTYTIATVFVSFAQLGTISYSIREIAYCKEKKDKSKVFWNVFTLRFLTVLVSLLVYVFLFCRAGSKYYDLFLVQSLCIIGVLFDVSWFYQGIEQFRIIAIRDILSKVVSIICVFLFVKQKSDVGLYAFLLAIAIIGGRLASWLTLPKYLEKPNFFNIAPFRDIQTILLMFIPQVANQLYIAVDKIMIGYIVPGGFESGYYAQADRIIKLGIAVLTAIVTVVSPRVAASFAADNREAVRKYAVWTIKFIEFVGFPMAAGLSVLITFVIPWFFGPGYDQVAEIVYILSIQVVIIGFTTVFGMILVNIQKQKQHAISVTIGVLLNILLNAVLIPSFFSKGAAVASVVAEFLIFLIELYFLRGTIHWKDLIEDVHYYIIGSATVVAVVMLMKKHVAPSFVGSIFLIAVGGIVYFLTLYAMQNEMIKKFFEEAKVCIKQRRFDKRG